MQNFRLIIIVPLFTGFYMVVACIILFCSKTGSKRVNDELHKCVLPRMKTGLLMLQLSLLHEIKNIM